MNFKHTFFIIVSLFVFISPSACNLPAGQPTPIVVTATVDLGATITAQAQFIQGGNQPLPEAPINTAQPQDTAAPEFTPTITLTPTPSIPTVSVSRNTNCRTGPGTQYDIIDALVIGQTAVVVGRNTPTNYWIIKRPTGSGECWLWGEYATISGDVSGLKEYAIPATPTPTAPEPVTNLKANKICFFDGFGYKLSGFITWQASDNTEQYWIYLNGNLHGMTFANQDTTYAIPALNLAPGGSISLGVQAISDFGKSPLREVTITCP